MNTGSDFLGLPPEIQKKRNEYTLVDSVSGIIAFIFGYLYIRWVFENSPSAGAFLFSLLLITGSVIYLKCKKIYISHRCYAFISVTLIFSFALILSSNLLIRRLVMQYVTLSTIFWFYSVCAGCGDGKIIDDMVVFNMLKAVFVMPLSCLGNVFGAFFSVFKKLKSTKKILMIIAGLILAVIPTIAVTSLLIRADDAFRNMTESFISKITLPANIRYEIFIFIIGIPVAMYMFGVLYSNSERKNEEIMTREKNENFIKRIKFTPELVVFAAVTPICVVYILFFLSQSAYFLSAFSNIIPEGFTYAEYARKGFFELCSVAVINLCVIIFICLFAKKERDNPLAIKIYVTVISAFTLMMISIAVSKMAMYIRAFGLTLLRVYTTWFMILLAVLFVLIIIRQFNKVFKIFSYLFAAFVILFALLVFTDVDSVISNYNIDRYLDGSLPDVDIDMINYELSDSAVPALLKLTGDLKYGNTVQNILLHKRDTMENSLNFPNFNLSSWRALKNLS